MKIKNGKKNRVTKGKNKTFTVFSVFVIFISIILNISYEYNNAVTIHYKQYYEDSDEEEEFTQRVATIYNGYLNNGSSINLNVFLATVVVSESKAGIRPYEITNEDIHTIFKCMNNDPNISDYSLIGYNEEAFRRNIKEKWLTKGKFLEVTLDYSDEELDSIVNDIFNQVEVYEVLYGEEGDPHFSSGGTCTYKVGNQNYSNINVKLLNCEGNTYVDGEELIDFENHELQPWDAFCVKVGY